MPVVVSVPLGTYSNSSITFTTIAISISIFIKFDASLYLLRALVYNCIFSIYLIAQNEIVLSCSNHNIFVQFVSSYKIFFQAVILF